MRDFKSFSEIERLQSRDERYLLTYPNSLPQIAKDYLVDLEKEAQLDGIDEAVQKSLRKQVFGWIREIAKERGLAT